MSRFLERWTPLVIGLSTSLVWYFWFAGALPDKLDELLAATLNLSAIAAGFLSTAVGILLSIYDRPIVRRLREMGDYEQLVMYLTRAIYSTVAAAMVSVAGVLSGPKASWPWPEWVGAMGLFVLVWAGGACLRVVALLLRLLQEMSRGDAQG